MTQREDGGVQRPSEGELARPQRPRLEGLAPAPVTGPAARTAIAERTMTALWWSVSLLMFAALTLFLTRQTAQDNLEGLLVAARPALDAKSLANPVARLVDLVMAVLLLLALLQAICISRLGRGSRWPRIVLVLVLLIQGAVAVPTSLLAPHRSWQGWLLTAALLLGVLASLAGTVLAWTPAMSRWLARRRAGPAEAQDTAH